LNLIAEQRLINLAVLHRMSSSSEADAKRRTEERELPLTVQIFTTRDRKSRHGAETVCIRMLVSSDLDAFLHYRYILDENMFQQLQDRYQLQIQFTEFPDFLCLLLQRCQQRLENLEAQEAQQSGQYDMVIFKTGADQNGNLQQHARLSVIRVSPGLPAMDLLSLQLSRSPEHLVKQHVAQQCQRMQVQIEDHNSSIARVTAELTSLRSNTVSLQARQSDLNSRFVV
jgi:hypothetical protein